MATGRGRLTNTMTRAGCRRTWSREVDNLMSYLPGIGWIDSDPGTPQAGAYYSHGDQIGTLRASSDQQSAVSYRVYTAFGEQVFADGQVGTRYQYAGEWVTSPASA